MAIAVLQLLLLLLLLLLLDAVSGTHALDQSCEDDDDSDKCVYSQLCCWAVLYLH